MPSPGWKQAGDRSARSHERIIDARCLLRHIEVLRYTGGVSRLHVALFLKGSS